MSKKISIIVGSTRSGRVGHTIAEWFYQQVKDTDELDFEIVDLAEWDLPLLTEPIPAKFAPVQHEHSKKWTAKVAEADGYVIVTAEHNHSIPASLKNALDYVYHEWGNKPVAFVSYSWTGGEKAISHLTDITKNLKMNVLPERVNITFNPTMLDEQNQLADPKKDLAPHAEAATKVARAFL